MIQVVAGAFMELCTCPEKYCSCRHAMVRLQTYFMFIKYMSGLSFFTATCTISKLSDSAGDSADDSVGDSADDSVGDSVGDSADEILLQELRSR